MDNIVSIIVPVYNVARYLPECLDSIIEQTYKNLQIILVDDGSTDESGIICDEYATRDTRITVIHQVNAGAANAKNAGLDVATGQFIAFVDSDDWVDSEWIEKLLSASLQSGADVVECSFRMEYVTHSTMGNDPQTFVYKLFETEEFLCQYPTLWSCALFWNKFFRNKLLRDIRFHTERRCIDDEFFTYKAVTGANAVLRITDEPYHYRQRLSSVTQKDSTLFQRTIDDIDILKERHQWMTSYYPNIALDYLRHDVDTQLYLAMSKLFNNDAIIHFRESAKYYFDQCLKNYPGKTAFYYAFKARFYATRKFNKEMSTNPEKSNMDDYFA